MAATGVRPLDWNLSFVLWHLSRPPFEPLKLASDKHLTWKTFCSLALVSAKGVSELLMRLEVLYLLLSS